MRQKQLQFLYIIFDLLSGVTVWYLLYRYRKLVVEPQKFGAIPEMVYTPNFLLGLILVPMFWVALFWFFGAYRNPLRRTKTIELSQTLLVTILGVLVIFFTILINDEIATYKNYFEVLWVFLPLQLSFTLFFRLVIVSTTLNKIKKGDISFKTLLIGGGERAEHLLKELKIHPDKQGFDLIGFLSINGNDKQIATSNLKYLGEVSALNQVQNNYEIEEVLIALEPSEHHKLEGIISEIQNPETRVKIVPDMFSIISGQVKMSNIFGAPLIEVERGLMSAWQFNTKRIIDLLVSASLLVILSPLLLIISILIKLDSKGPIFYLQERLGKGGVPFKIIKFRTMRQNAEESGPQLSHANDSRITKFGKILRKTRLDEIPNFINVIKGEMSLVGPRPERAFYANQLINLAPYYKNLSRVRPGITSWGQVKYGYAENLEQMQQRLKFDLIYIENMNLAVDFKILFYTILTILRFEGK
jgi:exopolysaccharide biosynthesis polyprenyl glycosylphosphotransferase